MEMEGIMVRMLPGILGTLSRIVANKNMALPLLMFLSCKLLTSCYCGSADCLISSM